MIVDRNPIEETVIHLSFDEGHTIFGGVFEMNALKVGDDWKAVRDGGKGFVDGHGLERTADSRIA